MNKETTTVRVAGKDYTLTSSDGAEHLERVAAYVDRRITETMYATRLTRENVAVLTAMNITDELMKAQDENARLRRELNSLRGTKE